jgi:hypothetical protein
MATIIEEREIFQFTVRCRFGRLFVFTGRCCPNSERCVLSHSFSDEPSNHEYDANRKGRANDTPTAQPPISDYFQDTRISARARM